MFTDFRDSEGLRAEAALAACDGFTAKAAIHPDQIEIINAAFTPRPEQIDLARRIVTLFEQDGATGVVALDGRMLDRPHLILAKRILSRARLG